MPETFTYVVPGEWTSIAFTGYNVVSVSNGPCFIAPDGTTNGASGVRFAGSTFFPECVAMLRGPCVVTVTQWVDEAAPAPFTTDMFSLAVAPNADVATLTIIELPNLNGYPVDLIEWSANGGGNWYPLTRTTPGDEDLTVLTGSISLRITTGQGTSIVSGSLDITE